MRETLFRGKAVDSGEWAYGDLVHYDGEPSIHRKTTYGLYKNYPVDPATVGEYTGLTDKNGVRIFEGDILRSVGRVGTLYSEVRIGDCLPGVLREYEREHRLEPRRAIAPHCLFESGEEALLIIGSDGTVNAEVVGNVHDNPEWREEGWTSESD